MNAFTTLFLAILACSSIELASSVQFFEFPEGSLEKLLFELDTYDFPRFNLILNEEDAHDLFNQEDIFASDAFDYLGEAVFDGENNEVSLDDFIPPSEEVLEVLTFVDLINKKDYDIDSLFEDNGFFQAPEVQSEHNCDNFNEELASALFDVKSGEEQLNMMLSALVLNVVNNMEENGETETALFELPLALSGVAAAAADGFNGVDGEQEKGEENLDAKYNFILEGRNKHAEASSLNLYLTIGCVTVALLVIGAIVVGVKDLRKHEETLEEATSSDYFELSY